MMLPRSLLYGYTRRAASWILGYTRQTKSRMSRNNQFAPYTITHASPATPTCTGELYYIRSLPVQSRVEAAVFKLFDKARLDKLFRFRIGNLWGGCRHEIH